MIPSGGMDMTCRRCASAFHVDMPERTQAGPISLPPEDAPIRAGEATAVGVVDPPTPQNVEPTRIGVVTPFDESEESEEEKPVSLIAPTGQMYAPTARFEPLSPSKPRPKTPVTHGRAVPPADAEMGLDPELDDTVRLDSEDAGVLSDQAVALLEPPHDTARNVKTDIGDLSQIPERPEAPEPDDLSVGSGPNGLYERVAAGAYVPEEPKEAQPSLSRVRAKNWDEASAYDTPGAPLDRALAAFRRAAAIFNRTPLAFKVALVVFPLTLGVALMFTSNGAQTPPKVDVVKIEIPAAATASAEDAPPPSEEVAAAKEAAAPKRKIALPGDAPAPADHAYVQVDRARLRGEPGESGEPSGRLELGTLVRIYERVDQFALVMAQPKGPAGFISEKLIGAKKPIALLAKEIAFAACEVTEEYNLDDCLYQGKQQHDACLEACGVAVGGGEDSPTVRCAEACKVAFNECQRSCNGDGAKKKVNAPARATRTVPRASTKPR